MRYYVVSYRHPGGGRWYDYGEPIPHTNNPAGVAIPHNLTRFINQAAPFTEIRIKVLDVAENN